jgi:beta-glucanase (GH16 family)
MRSVPPLVHLAISLLLATVSAVAPSAAGAAQATSENPPPAGPTVQMTLKPGAVPGFPAPRESVVSLTQENLPDGGLRLKAPKSVLDLSRCLQVSLRVKNSDSTTALIRARLLSVPGATAWVSARKPTAPGRVAEIVVPFDEGPARFSGSFVLLSGSRFESDHLSAIEVEAEGDLTHKLQVVSICASVPRPPALPSWLGKRPPVPGRWRKTMSEEFDGPEVDEKLWSIYHPNYWDPTAHFSKENVIPGGGLLRLRFEHKRGHADDDPTKPETDWATGFLTGTHKWTQRYGYFECRMKLPHAPGMWPAFWMMPDRGPAANHDEDTAKGGMEFDILEYLARFGPYRYNVACHWDGYGSSHRVCACDRIYVQPDKEGFYTAGLLWDPGEATFYCNGRVVAHWKSPRVCSVPMYILFTAVSGGWGAPISVTGEGLPSDYVLDYVRVWQRE